MGCLPSRPPSNDGTFDPNNIGTLAYLIPEMRNHIGSYITNPKDIVSLMTVSKAMQNAIIRGAIQKSPALRDDYNNIHWWYRIPKNPANYNAMLNSFGEAMADVLFIGGIPYIMICIDPEENIKKMGPFKIMGIKYLGFGSVLVTLEHFNDYIYAFPPKSTHLFLGCTYTKQNLPNPLPSHIHDTTPLTQRLMGTSIPIPLKDVMLFHGRTPRLNFRLSLSQMQQLLLPNHYTDAPFSIYFENWQAGEHWGDMMKLMDKLIPRAIAHDKVENGTDALRKALSRVAGLEDNDISTMIPGKEFRGGRAPERMVLTIPSEEERNNVRDRVREWFEAHPELV